MKSNRWKRIIVALVFGVLGVIGLGGWALASPVGSSPDDDFHLSSIWCAFGDRENLCQPGNEAGVSIVPQRLVLASHCFAFRPAQSASCVTMEDAEIATTRFNTGGNYPPLFYAVTGAFASDNIDASVVGIRLFNSALFIGAVMAVLSLLRPGQRGPLIWTSVIALVPAGMFFIASVNPSSWAIISGLTTWVALTGYFSAEQKGRQIALGGLSLMLGLMGAGARSDAAVYVAFSALAAMILTCDRSRHWIKLAIVPLLLIVVGAISFLTSGQTSWAVVATLEQASGSGAGSGLGQVLSNLTKLPFLWSGNLGTWGLGWLDTPLPESVWVIMIGVFAAVLFWGARFITRRKAIVLSLALLTLIVMPLYVLYGQNAVVGTEVQPRYLLPLILIFAGLALYGSTRDDLGLSKFQGFAVLASVSVANALALHTNMKRYISGLDSSGANLNNHMEWWWEIPVQPMTVWLIASAAFALAMVCLYCLLFTTRGRLFILIEEPVKLESLPRSIVSDDVTHKSTSQLQGTDEVN